jgi:hypothetical protein
MQQSQVVQQSTVLPASQASMAPSHQTMIETQGTVAIQQNSGANTGAAPIVMTSQASQTLAMAVTDRNTIYMAPMSRPVPMGQQSGVTQVKVLIKKGLCCSLTLKYCDL